MDGIQCVVLKVYKPLDKAQWLSWLERRPVTAEVTGSSPVWVVSFILGRLFLSLAGSDRDLFCAAVAELADARDLKSRG